ncbi:mitogen-activated protein kinase kinase 10 [Dioscorea cayenensis subsp. rotundata]|uniref:Mitogen-activated protein kinase kinase 10 n=1 Tax=Dioscorea cayennensis subsp. rotundata TaxID=55577 RepID=A0AB40CPZ3_DIOCR|nr:mitogen-activated protein kinase kinase 10 [Dioscorea cayenensis subsp. rotundata]
MAMVRERRHQQPLRISPPLPDLHLPPPPSFPFLPFSDLEKLGVIGHGTDATVYKARDSHTHSIYALKVLRLGLNSSSDALRRAAREADIHNHLNSQYVVRFYGVLAGEDDKLALVMEYMDGGTLEDFIKARRRPLAEELIAGVARRVLEGLCYLHDNGVVHRDIKPANLLISGDGEVKIGDFGASRRVVVAGDVWEACEGTCAYMSPERMDGEGFGGGGDGGGCPGDVWALGVVLLECKVGRFPLVAAGERPDWATLMCAACFGEPTPMVPEAASPEFRSFVGRCLEKDWRRRGSARELLSHPFIIDHVHCQCLLTSYTTTNLSSCF